MAGCVVWFKTASPLFWCHNYHVDEKMFAGFRQQQFSFGPTGQSLQSLTFLDPWCCFISVCLTPLKRSSYFHLETSRFQGMCVTSMIRQNTHTPTVPTVFRSSHWSWRIICLHVCEYEDTDIRLCLCVLWDWDLVSEIACTATPWDHPEKITCFFFILEYNMQIRLLLSHLYLNRPQFIIKNKSVAG